MKSPWKKLSSKIVYKNPWIKVKEDKVIRPDGKRGIYGYIETTDSVAIVVINDKNEIYLVKQWRYTYKKGTIELPWGSVDNNENPLKAAKRELKEETGLAAKNWLSLGYLDIYPGLSVEKAFIFLARGLKLSKSEPENTEKLKVLKMPFEKAYQMLIEQKINDAVSMAAILRTKEYLKL